MTIDALKFFQAYIREMIEIGGENLPKTISTDLGANLAKIYKKRGITTIEEALKAMYSVLGAKIELKQIDTNKLEIAIKYHDTFCPIGGKYDPNKSELFQKSLCIPYTMGLLNEMDSTFKYNWDIHQCILNTGNNCCKYSLYLEKRNQLNKVNRS